jgi:zinc protease
VSTEQLLNGRARAALATTRARRGDHARRRARPGAAAIASCLTGLLLLVVACVASATPPIETWQTTEGAKVLFSPAPDLPMVDVRVVFDAGSARDGGQPGLAALTGAMLDQGAGDLDANSIAERIESVGAKLSTGAGRDMATVSLRSLTDPKALEPAVETLLRVLGEPTFDAGELERVRRNTLTALRLAEQDPGSVASKAFYRAVFGEHPYASDPSGTPESVSAVEADDLRAFHQRYYTAPNATIAIVGALSRPQAETLAGRISATLPAGEAPPPLPQVPDLSGASEARIAFPSSQTHILAGQPGMSRGDPDYFPLYVGNHILGGGGLVSLLMDEVREERGLSYSVYSYFAPMARPGPFTLGLQTKNDQADQALSVLLDTLERFVTDGPTADELESAKKNLTGGFPLRIASNAKVVQYLAVIGFYDLPLDYLERFTDRVDAVTSEQIRDAFRRRVQPERLAVVMVGGGEPGSEDPGAPNEPSGKDAAPALAPPVPAMGGEQPPPAPLQAPTIGRGGGQD